MTLPAELRAEADSWPTVHDSDRRVIALLHRAADALEWQEYWKQRAKAAEGHLQGSDMLAAAKAVHTITTWSHIPWDGLTATVRYGCERAANVAIMAVNDARAIRKPSFAKQTLPATPEGE